MGPAGILSIIGTARGGLWKLGIVWDGEFARHLPGRGAGSMENKMGWGSPEGFGDHCGFWGSQWVLGITDNFGDPGGFWGSWLVLQIPGGFGDPEGFWGSQWVSEMVPLQAGIFGHLVFHEC